MPKIEQNTREAIAAFLPGAIAAALQSYSNFLEEQATSEEQPDSKDFKAHHDACKVAIAHIELLVKLAKWADLPDPVLGDQARHAELQAMIALANAEIAESENGE